MTGERNDCNGGHHRPSPSAEPIARYGSNPEIARLQPQSSLTARRGDGLRSDRDYTLPAANSLPARVTKCRIFPRMRKTTVLAPGRAFHWRR